MFFIKRPTALLIIVRTISCEHDEVIRNGIMRRLAIRYHAEGRIARKPIFH